MIKKVMKYLIGLGLILTVLFFTGILKKLPNIKGLPYVGDLELTDNCIRKNCDGNYILSILFEKSENRSFVKQKMELFYSIKIKKNNCTITGTGYKSGEQVTDTLTQDKVRRAYSENKFPVTAIGQIINDTMFIEISKNTKSNTDHKISLSFPFLGNEISLVRGVFKEELMNSSGKAKLSKQ